MTTFKKTFFVFVESFLEIFLFVEYEFSNWLWDVSMFFVHYWFITAQNDRFPTWIDIHENMRDDAFSPKIAFFPNRFYLFVLFPKWWEQKMMTLMIDELILLHGINSMTLD